MGFSVICGKQNLIKAITNDPLNQGKYATVHLIGIIVTNEEGKEKEKEGEEEGKERRKKRKQRKRRRRKKRKKKTRTIEAISYQLPNVWQAFYKEFSK